MTSKPVLARIVGPGGDQLASGPDGRIQNLYARLGVLPPPAVTGPLDDFELVVLCGRHADDQVELGECGEPVLNCLPPQQVIG